MHTVQAKNPHATKSGPGRYHKPGKGKVDYSGDPLPCGYPGAKAARKAAQGRLTK